MAQINMAQRPESGLDALAKALNVAQSIYGITSDMSRLNMAKEAQAKQLAEEERANQGFISSKEALEYGKDYEISDQATPGAFQRKLQEGDQVRDLYLTPRKKSDDKPFALGQKDIVDIYQNGGSLTAPGKGERDVSIVGPDGKAQVVGLKPPKSKTGLSDVLQALAVKQKQQDIEKSEREANSEEALFKKLPVESQKQIELLASKNAAKIDIKNSIDSAMGLFRDPKVSEDQKIKAGQTLIKTLNSQQGQDAVGAEESKRLGSFLEYKIANFTQPGSFIGRDLDEFITQAGLTSQQISETLKSNQSKIDELYGRQRPLNVNIAGTPGQTQKVDSGIVPSARASDSIGKPDAHDIEALRWLQTNPRSPDAEGVRAKLRAKGLL